MRWERPETAEVAGRGDDAATEMVHPHPIRQNTRRRAGLSGPVNQRPTPSGVRSSARRRFWKGIQCGRPFPVRKPTMPRHDRLLGLAIVAAMKQFCFRYMGGRLDQGAQEFLGRLPLRTLAIRSSNFFRSSAACWLY